MKSQTNYFIIGLFVVLGVLVLCVSLVIIGGRQKSGIEFKGETSFRESVSGLSIDSPVRFRGIKIGEVDAINIARVLYKTESQDIVVRFTVRPQGDGSVEDFKEYVTDLIDRGLRFQLKSNALTGVSYLDADMKTDVDGYETPDWSAEPEAADYLYIPSVPGLLTDLGEDIKKFLDNLSEADIAGTIKSAKETLDALTKKINDLDVKKIGEEIEQVLLTADQTIKNVDKEIPDLVAAWKDAGRSVETAANDLDAILKDAKIQSILTNVDDATAEAKELLADPDIGAAIDNVRDVTQNLKTTVAELDATLHDARGLVRSGRRLIDGKGRDIDVILKNVERITQHLDNLMGTLDRYPSYLIFGTPPPKKGPGE